MSEAGGGHELRQLPRLDPGEEEEEIKRWCFSLLSLWFSYGRDHSQNSDFFPEFNCLSFFLRSDESWNSNFFSQNSDIFPWDSNLFLGILTSVLEFCLFLGILAVFDSDFVSLGILSSVLEFGFFLRIFFS